MRNKFLVFSLSILLVSANFAFAKSHGAKIASVGATVSGYVELITKTDRNFPDDLLSLYLGNDDSLFIDKKGKKGKKINVTGNYEAGSSFVRVVEDTDVSSTTPKYSFNLPVPAKVASFTAGKFTKTDTFAALYFASEQVLDENGLGDDDDDGGNNSLVKLFKKKFIKSKKPKSPIKKFKAKLHKIAVQRFLATQTASVSEFGGFVSVKKVIATRKGNKGTLKGTFQRTGSPASGRFSLDMTFDE